MSTEVSPFAAIKIIKHSFLNKKEEVQYGHTIEFRSIICR